MKKKVLITSLLCMATAVTLLAGCGTTGGETETKENDTVVEQSTETATDDKQGTTATEAEDTTGTEGTVEESTENPYMKDIRLFLEAQEVMTMEGQSDIPWEMLVFVGRSMLDDREIKFTSVETFDFVKHTAYDNKDYNEFLDVHVSRGYDEGDIANFYGIARNMESESECSFANAYECWVAKMAEHNMDFTTGEFTEANGVVSYVETHHTEYDNGEMYGMKSTIIWDETVTLTFERQADGSLKPVSFNSVLVTTTHEPKTRVKDDIPVTEVFGNYFDNPEYYDVFVEESVTDEVSSLITYSYDK